MAIDKLLLRMPAKTSWYDFPKEGELTGLRIRDHKTLKEAIVFVMEELDESTRKSVWIRTADDGFMIRDIEKLYREIVGGKAS